MLNLCCHEKDFRIHANWTFFATSHGKSPCDGIEVTVNRLTARASLQRPYSEQILTASQMLLFCQKNIANVRFLYFSKEEMVDVREHLKNIFLSGRTIPGTRGYHFFEPRYTRMIASKRTAEDDTFAGKFNITGKTSVPMSMNAVKLRDYISCRYDGKWWIGLIEELNNEQQDFKVSFLQWIYFR